MNKPQTPEQRKRNAEEFLYFTADGGLALDAEKFLRDPEVQEKLKALNKNFKERQRRSSKKAGGTGKKPKGKTARR